MHHVTYSAQIGLTTRYKTDNEIAADAAKKSQTLTEAVNRSRMSEVDREMNKIREKTPSYGHGGYHGIAVHHGGPIVTGHHGVAFLHGGHHGVAVHHSGPIVSGHHGVAVHHSGPIVARHHGVVVHNSGPIVAGHHGVAVLHGGHHGVAVLHGGHHGVAVLHRGYL
uniref:Uncharacterized protein n=1 Tax=viral metagenome TaxID=1070528 RepID=A0A6C0DA22_9ZZZZ